MTITWSVVVFLNVALLFCGQFVVLIFLFLVFRNFVPSCSCSDDTLFM